MEELGWDARESGQMSEVGHDDGNVTHRPVTRPEKVPAQQLLYHFPSPPPPNIIFLKNKEVPGIL